MMKVHDGGMNRRSFLRSTLATALALAHGGRAFAGAKPSRPKSLIFLYLSGGPSQLDTFDPKPGRREGGRFRAIRTSVKGLSFTEHLPRLAERARDLVVLRTMTSKEGSHERARHLLHTGYSPIPGTGFPCMGSTLGEEIGPAPFALPHYVCLGGTGEKAGLRGPAHEPFVVRSLETGVLPHIETWRGTTTARLRERLDLQRVLNQEYGHRVNSDLSDKYQSLMDRAYSMMTTPLLEAFDWKKEPEAVRRVYGEGSFARHCLVARRLVEAGVSCVEVELDGWDTHKDNFTGHQKLLSRLDPAFAALLGDLEARELLDSTMVLCAGEFGRSPSVNADEGRDHHPECFSAVLAGAGLKRGVVLGESDATGGRAVGASVTIPDLLATMLHSLGIDPAKTLMAGDRPIALGNDGKLLREILA